MRALAMGLCLFCAMAIRVGAECRQALALGLDVSGSVDLQEYRLQLDGLVSALNHPDVLRLLLGSQSAPVALLVYEWSGPEDQVLLVAWTDIRTPADVDFVSGILATTTRRTAAPGTALGTAMARGLEYLEQRRDCWKRTLDISGDGQSNLGPRPRDVKPKIASAGITVNALVVGADAPVGADRRQSDIAELSSYFRTEVIVGEEAFVQTALGFSAYADAMTAKLRRELQDVVIGALQ
ncbi:MAG: DUF1194 domain-containing protein [Pseudomonadota bacterium]